MKEHCLAADIVVFCVPAHSVPDGIKEAFHTVCGLVPSMDSRIPFGISYRDHQGQFVYKAALNELQEAEGKNLGCESFTIKKGNYLVQTVSNWQGREELIGAAFEELMANPGIDAMYPAIEWYDLSKQEVMCMLRLLPSADQ